MWIQCGFSSILILVNTCKYFFFKTHLYLWNPVDVLYITRLFSYGYSHWKVAFQDPKYIWGRLTLRRTWNVTFLGKVYSHSSSCLSVCWRDRVRDGKGSIFWWQTNVFLTVQNHELPYIGQMNIHRFQLLRWNPGIIPRLPTHNRYI